MRRKYKKVYTTLNYMKHFFVLASTVTGCVSIFAFASLFGMPVGIVSSAVVLKISITTAGIKKYKSIITKKKKKHEKLTLLAKTNINSKGFLIPKDVINSHIIHVEFVSIKHVLQEYHDMKEEKKRQKFLIMNKFDVTKELLIDYER